MRTSLVIPLTDGCRKANFLNRNPPGRIGIDTERTLRPSVSGNAEFAPDLSNDAQMAVQK